MRCYVTIVLLGLSSTLATGALFPPVREVGIRLSELVGKSSFVCKGEITSAPETKVVNGPLPRKSGVAVFRIDTCFKGKLDGGQVRVAADEYLPAAGWAGGGHVFTPQVGEYLLLFLKKKGDTFDLADENRGALPVSRLTSTRSPTNNTLENMEEDFKAGLADPDAGLVLKSILWLGCMQHLRSTAALHALLERADPVERLYIWEALLKVGDVSVIGQASRYLDENPPAFRPLFFPADRLSQMIGRVFSALCDVRGPKVVPQLTHFTKSSEPRIRLRALMGLRAIGSLGSAPVFLRELDDHHEDMDFIAMQALFELAGGGPIDWVENMHDFSANASYYAERCREWWSDEGEAKAKARFRAASSIQAK